MSGRVYPTFDRLAGARYERTCQISACKRYTLCWVGVEGGWLHEAWFGKQRIAARGPIDRRSEHLVEMTLRALHRECIRHAVQHGINAEKGAA